MESSNAKESRNSEVQELDRQGVSRAEIARQFGISRQRVLQICGAKHAPGRKGKYVIPEADIPDLKLALARCEITIEEVAQKYGTSRKYAYRFIAGYKELRKQLGLYKCRRCKKAYRRSEMTSERTCRQCNDDYAVERYRRHRESREDDAPCPKCGMPVSGHHLAQLNHDKWHARVDRENNHE